MKLKKILFWLIPPLLLGIFSTLVILPLSKGIISLGESSLQLNPSYYNFLSLWEEKVNFGTLSSHQANLVLYVFIYDFFNLIFKTIHPSVVFNFLSFFLPGFFFYLAGLSLLKPKNNLVLLPASLLYAFNAFRIFSGINEIVSMLLISLPLFMWFHLRFLETSKWRYGLALVIVSFLFSSMGANLPVFSIPYLLIILQLLIYLIFFRRGFGFKKIILNHSLLFALLIFTNLFWIIPTLFGLLSAYENPAIRGSIFTALGSGTFLDHFRFIGSWAWRSGHANRLYFPSSVIFDQPPFMLLSMIIPCLVIFALSLLGDIKDKTHKVLFFTMAGLYPISFILLASTKGPFGLILEMLYRIFPYLLIFRDPFAKFTPLFVLSSSVLLILTTSYLISRKNKVISSLSIPLLTIIVLVLAYPFYSGKVFPPLAWGGGQVGYLVKIPGYWNDTKKWIESDLVEDKVTITPYARYGNNQLWPFGVSTSDVASEYLIDKPMIVGWDFDKREVNKLIAPLTTVGNVGAPWLSRYMGLLNSRMLLQQNETDWRFYNLTTPSKINDYLEKSGLTSINAFGNLTKEYLENIDQDPDRGRREELINELDGKKALIVYQGKNEDFTPLFYTPEQVIYSTASIEELPLYVKSDGWVTPGAVYFNNFKANGSIHEFLEKNTTKINKQICPDTICESYQTSNRPVVEFKKISATKFRLILHAVKTTIPLVFSESYDPNWKLFASEYHSNVSPALVEKLSEFENLNDFQATKDELNSFITKGWLTSLGDGKGKPQYQTEFVNNIRRKIRTGTVTVDFVSKNLNGTIQNNNLKFGGLTETWLKKPIFLESEHYIANGYANSWLIDPQKICSEHKNACQIKDGKYDIELVLELAPQKIFDIFLIGAVATVILCVIALIISILKKR